MHNDYYDDAEYTPRAVAVEPDGTERHIDFDAARGIALRIGRESVGLRWADLSADKQQAVVNYLAVVAAKVLAMTGRPWEPVGDPLARLEQAEQALLAAKHQGEAVRKTLFNPLLGVPHGTQFRREYMGEWHGSAEPALPAGPNRAGDGHGFRSPDGGYVQPPRPETPIDLTPIRIDIGPVCHSKAVLDRVEVAGDGVLTVTPPVPPPTETVEYVRPPHGSVFLTGGYELEPTEFEAKTTFVVPADGADPHHVVLDRKES